MERAMVAPESAQLYAAVDMGSNSFHMVVVRVENGSVQIIGKIKQKVRLAAGLDEAFNLDDESMQRGWDCLATFAERLQDIPPNNIQVVATATLRLANNADVFLHKAEAILAHKIRVISGEEEARQIYLGVAYTSANQGNTLVIDIGGASTEVIVGSDFEPKQLVSLNMGCVTFYERYFPDGTYTQTNFDAAVTAASENIAPIVEQFIQFDWQQCLGASGTPQAITEILVTQGVNDSIRRAYLYELRDQCIACGSLENLNIDGLMENRKGVFASGLAILIALFEQLQISEMQISGGALREGLIYGMLENRQRSGLRQQSLDNFIKRFHIDAKQASRVSDVALALFQQLDMSVCELDAEGILHGAASLHEIGLHIEYKQSHLHGAYILRHLSLPGYNKLQQECIRDLVQNHRQQIDTSLLDNYQENLRQCLMLLTRLLRVASVVSIRRKDNFLPALKLKCDGEQLTLMFPKGWLKAHPLIDAELANEKWLQHKAGWPLDIL